jgi:cation diffusion facilitator CzcD-associated flavoprotein CzcO
MTPEHFDVLIVGAGLSGVGAGCHLQDRLPGTTYAIFEARDAIGGTWDLFRYPGIRSDSDMHTLGYDFRPWTEEKSIADGPSILRYINDTAREHGVDRHIRFGHRIVSASWSTDEARWTVRAERTDTGEQVAVTCGFLYLCSGYYRYDEGYTPEFPGRDRFRGEIVHPQHWPEDLDYAGKRVVVIGSGATAMTLVPAMAGDAAHVTMLQRSPTYVVSLPGEDPIAKGLRRVLPTNVAYAATRWKNVTLQTVQYQFSRRAPGAMKRLLHLGVKARLPEGYDMRHFTPSYNPWDQRLCLVPDGDLFKAISRGTASVVTDHIDTFDETGIRLRSGEHLEADIIITATGLNLLAFGGIDLEVDGGHVEISERMTYKGMMLQGVPNMAFAIGYTNASWTLKCDLTAMYLCRLLAHMHDRGQAWCRPENNDPEVTEQPLLDFQAGYVLRSAHEFPSQGSKPPWTMRMSYLQDVVALKRGEVDDGVMVFGGSRVAAGAAEPARVSAV